MTSLEAFDGAVISLASTRYKSHLMPDEVTMSTINTQNSDEAISRLRRAAHIGSLKTVVGELVTICKEVTVTQ
jgi:hypothetical protein